MPDSPRTLILLAKKRRPDLAREIAAGREPRVEYLELAARLGAGLVDFHTVESSASFLVRACARLGLRWGLAALGLLGRNQYDHLYATGEDVGIPLALFLRIVRCDGRLTVVVHNAGTPKRLKLLRAIGSRPYRHCICLGREQERVLTRDAGIPPAKVTRLHTWIDHRFFRPSAAGDGAYVLSVGMESRDYPTLQAAAAALPYAFRVVASGWSPGAGFAPAGGIRAAHNITIERGLSTTQLRTLYDGCRVVVVPLKRATYAAGVTSILEAMAMGKAVIVTASPGILDYVKDGVSGRLVPVGDPLALQRAIRELWEKPSLTAQMGAHNRAWIERSINTDAYVEEVATLFGVPPARDAMPAAR